MMRSYEQTFRSSLKHSLLILLVLIGSTVLNFYLFNVVPKSFFPDQYSGTLIGGIQGDSAISFQLMRKKMDEIQTIVQEDPAVDSVVANTGGRQTNARNVWVTLKPLPERDPIAGVTARLPAKTGLVSGTSV